MEEIQVESLASVTASMSYTVQMTGPAHIRVFPPSSGRKLEFPKPERRTVPVYDCRPIAGNLTLDVAGFELREAPTSFNDFYSAEAVAKHYYPNVISILKAALGAQEVFVFDHNVRNKTRAAQKQPGVREPVDGAHNDYTLDSGPRRIREVLTENNAEHLLNHRAALVNLWRPIVGPVQDHPLAVCDARTTRIEDFIPTEIEHYLENDLQTPHLTGQIYSFQYSEAHRWFYVADMQPHEVLLLKCFDTATDGRACFTGHTGFANPAAPEDSAPRESIEARTVVVFPELKSETVS